MSHGKIVHLDPHGKTVAEIIEDLSAWQGDIQALVVAVRRDGQPYSVSYSLANTVTNAETIGALEIAKQLLAHDEVFPPEDADG